MAALELATIHFQATSNGMRALGKALADLGVALAPLTQPPPEAAALRELVIADAELLGETARQLETWARESRKGWSTHQVDPMLRHADRIWRHLGRCSRRDWSGQVIENAGGSSEPGGDR